MFGLGVQNETGQRLTEFCQENFLLEDTLPMYMKQYTYYIYYIMYVLHIYYYMKQYRVI